MINADQEQQWRSDISAARDAHQRWLLTEGRQAHRRARAEAVVDVERMLDLTSDLGVVTPEIIRQSPGILTTQRMSTAPPLARERLVTLARAERSVVLALEQDRLPGRTSAGELDAQLTRICQVIRGLIDPDLFGWLRDRVPPTPAQRRLASVAVANRLCDSMAGDLVRQQCHHHDLGLVQRWLTDHGFRPEGSDPPWSDVDATFALGPRRLPIPGRARPISADMIIRPADPARPLVVLTSVHGPGLAPVRRSSTTPWAPIRSSDRPIRRLHLLSGPVDLSDLHRRAAHGHDWIWAHRLDDLESALG